MLPGVRAAVQLALLGILHWYLFIMLHARSCSVGWGALSASL